MKNMIFLIILASVYSNSFSQYVQHFSTATYSTTLSNNIVNSIACDSMGIMWICTSEGLNKFDGNSWKVFLKKDGLPSDYTKEILIDTKQTKWINTDSGLVRYNDTTFQLINLPTINKMACDKSGFVWLATHKGVYKISDSESSVYYPNEHISDIFIDNLNNKWIAISCILGNTLNNGLIFFNDTIWEHVYYPEYDQGMICNGALRVVVDSLSNIWLDTDWDGPLKICNTEPCRSGRRLNNLPGIIERNYEPISPLYGQLFADKSYNIWGNIYTWTGKYMDYLTSGLKLGHAICKESSNYRITFNDSVTGIKGEMRAFCEDKNGNIWIGSQNGLHKYDGKVWINYNINCEFRNTVSQARIDKNGDVWFNVGNGLMSYLNKKWQFVQFTNHIIDFNFDSNNLLWYTDYKGLNKIHNDAPVLVDDKSGKIVICNDNRILINQDLCEKDIFDSVYIANSNGIFYINGDILMKKIELPIGVTSIFSFKIDSKNNIYIASDLGMYVYKSNDSIWLLISKDYCLEDISIDYQDNIWYIIPKKYKTKNKIFKYDLKIDSLYCYTVDFNPSSILFDLNGNRWVGSDNGIYLFNDSLKALDANPKFFQFDSEGYLSDTISILSNTQWHFISNSNWINIDTTRGFGNKKVIISTKENTNQFDREATFVVESDSTGNQIIKIKQNKKLLNSISESIKDIQIFPNPVNEHLTIIYKNSNTYRIQIYNMNGMLLFNKLISRNTEIIDFKSYPKGYYILKIISNEKTSVHKVQKI